MIEKLKQKLKKEDLDRINETIGIEDDIYGFASIVTAKADYILDVHYSYYCELPKRVTLTQCNDKKT